MSADRQQAARGFFGIGIENTKTAANIGTLWRTAHILGADFMFTIGKRYSKQASDTTKAWRSVPLYNYEDFDQFYAALPYDCRLVGVELDSKAVPLHRFRHPERCVYLLGAEDHGLTKRAQDACHQMIVLPGEMSMNVAVAGSIVVHDRFAKMDRTAVPA